MYFRQYSTNADTLKEWARQLKVVNNANYPLYPTVESTLSHWKSTLNQSTGLNTFDFNGDVNSTIYNWKEKLNKIYN